MPFILFVFALFLLGLLALRVLRLIKTSPLGADEPVRFPPLLGWSLALAVVALNVFAYDAEFGIGYGLFGFCVFLAIVLLFPSERRGKEIWFLTITGMVACVLFGFRANEFVQIVNVVTAAACAATLLFLRSIGEIRWHGVWLLKMQVGFLVRAVHRLFSLGTMLRPAKTSHGAKMLQTLKIAGITLIVLLFFSWILSAADPVFDQLVREVRQQALGRMALSALLLAGLLLFATVRVPTKWQEKVPQLTMVSFWDVCVPAVSLALLFGVFLSVQARYLFGTHAGFFTLDITYAEYVRRGFLELLVASFAGSVLTYAVILKQRTLTDSGRVRALGWVNGVLLVELLLLLASAAKRDWMYIEMYGLTRVRIIGAIFLLWLLTMIMLLFALNALRTMTERTLLGGAAIASAFVVLLLNAINIDVMIALAQPPRDMRPDIVTISRLSPDAVEGWEAAIAEADARYEALRTKTEFSEEEKTLLADAKITVAQLEGKLMRLLEDRSWQEWTASRAHAVAVLDDKIGFDPLDRAQCVRRGIRDLQLATHTDLYEQETRRTIDEEAAFLFDQPFVWPETMEDITTSGSGMMVPGSCG